MFSEYKINISRAIVAAGYRKLLKMALIVNRCPCSSRASVNGIAKLPRGPVVGMQVPSYRYAPRRCSEKEIFQMLYNLNMQSAKDSVSNRIPERLKSNFQEYSLDQLNTRRDANLVIHRVLEFGNWDEIHWLFELYGSKRIRRFIRAYGERWLKPVSFNYWRQLLRIRRWKTSPFPRPEGETWLN